MDTQQLQDLALRLSMFTDMLEKRAERAVNTGEQQAGRIAEAARHLDGQARQLSHSVVQGVRQDAHQAIVEGVGEGMRKGAEQLQHYVGAAQQATHALDRQVAELRRVSQSMVWKAGAGLLVGAVLAAFGSGLYAWHSLKQVREARFPTEVLQATQDGSITRCGDRLCVRAGAQPEHYQRNPQYVMLQASPAQ